MINLKNPQLIQSLPIYLSYGATIFLSAFLLFLIQPLISKYILPWFGGTASVWTMTMLFFQTTLLLGYVYAHLISKYLRPRKQIILHLLLLFITLITLSILPKDSLKPQANDNPVLHILILLSLAVGLPAIILSATSPLIQNWFAKVKTKESPYQLYALSNAGSLLGLISFPFYLEPLLSIKTQSRLWSALFFIFVLLFIFSAAYLFRSSFGKKEDFKAELNADADPKPDLKKIFLWLAFSACASILLLAVTNKISQDISVVPIFWVVPLSLYLFSFIIPFGSQKFAKRFSKEFPYCLMCAAVIIVVFWLVMGIISVKLWQIVTLLFLLFFFSLVCNVELVKSKPGPQYLTIFYLMVALGGVLGASLTGLVAPLIFNSYAELPLILAICLALSLWLAWADKIRRLYLFFCQKRIIYRKIFYVGLILFAMYVFLTCLAIGLFFKNFYPISTLVASRNFYGTLRVKELKGANPDNNELVLISGGTIHGLQFTEMEKHKIPTTYYGKNSGLGFVFNYFSDKKLRVGAIGLGTGTLAAFGKKGDYIKFYEINPQVVDLNKKYFTFLKDSLADIEIVLGDGRLSLEREQPQNFDLIVVDVFTGDSIPIHFLTKEAFEIYLKHLTSDGLLAVDINNRYLDLRPVLFKLAKTFNLQVDEIRTSGNENEGTTLTSWVLLSRHNQFFDSPRIKNNENQEIVKVDNFKLWTDDYSNLFSVLKF